jgi:hypothetical protein
MHDILSVLVWSTAGGVLGAAIVWATVWSLR